MIIAAIILFLIAAIFGLITLTAILRDRPTPKPAVLTHGPIAALALILIIIDIARGHTEALLITALVILLIAALGGFILFSLDMLKKHIPKTLAIVHPIVAVTGVIVLIIYAFL